MTCTDPGLRTPLEVGRELFEQALEDTDEPIDPLETQLELPGKVGEPD